MTYYGPRTRADERMEQELEDATCPICHSKGSVWEGFCGQCHQEPCPAHGCDSCGRDLPGCHVGGLVAFGCEGDFCLECRGWSADDIADAVCCEVWPA